jgi:hypothetical protein
VTILSVVPRVAPPVLATAKTPSSADTPIPRVIIQSVEGSRAASEPFAVPTPPVVTASNHTPPVAKERPTGLQPQLPEDPTLPPTLPHLDYGNMTAHPLFTHAPDYSWLIGELRYLPERNIWTVRFASVTEKIDTVTLIAPGPLTGLTSGQLVRVAGQLIASIPGEPNPGYRVYSVSPIHLR